VTIKWRIKKTIGFLFIIFFVCLHLGGLILHEIVEKAGLFSSMIHWKKYFPKEKI